MIDAEAAIFDRVAQAYDAAYPNGSRYSEATESPPQFPCMTLVEIDNATYDRTLDPREHNATITYEVNVYSNRMSGSKQECKAIMQLVDGEMQDLGFVRLFCNQTKNGDTRIYRMTARYRGVISEEYRIYKK